MRLKVGIQILLITTLSHTIATVLVEVFHPQYLARGEPMCRGDKSLLDKETCERSLREQIDILSKHKAESTNLNFQFVRIHAAMILQMADLMLFVQEAGSAATCNWEPGP